MKTLRLLTTAAFSGVLLFGIQVTANAHPPPTDPLPTPGVCTAPGLDKNRIIITIINDGGNAVVKISPYKIKFEDPRVSGPRTGDQKKVFICLAGATFYSGQEVVWNPRNPQAPAGEFTFDRAGPNKTWYVLNNENSIAGNYDFSVTIITSFGTMVVDPRIENGGGRH